MGRGIVSRFVCAMASVATAVFLGAGSSTPALAVATNPTLGSFDAAAPAANPYAGCVASILTGSGIVFGSQASLVSTLDSVWTTLPAAVATTCKQAVDTRQPQVCVAPATPAPCSGIGPAAVNELLTRVSSLPGNWTLVRDDAFCCGGYAETSLVNATPGTPMAMVSGQFTLPQNYCPSNPACSGKPGLWEGCDYFGCNAVSGMSVDFVGRTPDTAAGVRSHYYTKDGYGHPIYDIEGIYGQGYWGTGCNPLECNLTPGMKWMCLRPDGTPVPAGTTKEEQALTCSGQSLNVTLVFLSGPGGCPGCLNVGPTAARQVSMRMINYNLAWTANQPGCIYADCLRFDDPRLTYLDGAGKPTAVRYASATAPAAVVNLTSASLSCLVGVNVTNAGASCINVAGTVGSIVQAAQAPVVFAPPPIVSATAAPTANASGFARGPVTVTITAVSPSGPGVRSVTYTTSGALAIPTTIVAGSTAQITVDADGETDVDSYATDLSGTNSPTLRTVVKVDRSAPAITCAAPAPGWHLDNITVACTATGSLSGLADLTQAAFNLRTNVAAGTETANAATDSVSVCNRVGNCATAGPLTGIKIDRAAPSISITTPAGTYTAGQLVLADYTCSDSGSGVSTCAGPVAKGAPIDTNAAGPHTFTVTASDAVGNQSQAVMTYTVVARACDEERDAAGGADCNSDENNLINKVHPPKPPKAPAVGRTADHQDDHRDGHGKSKKSSSESGDGEGG